MLNKLSIKRKLLIYNVLIQGFILIILSFSIYKTLQVSTIDKIESSLKVIILDITDDIIDHKNELSDLSFNEENEYKFKPLYIRLLDVNKEPKVISPSYFPSSIPFTFNHIQNNTIHFVEHENYILGEIKFKMKGETYILQVATDYKVLNHTMENLFYILLFIVPIILIFSIIGGYFLIYKSFAPIEKILFDLKKINATTLSERLKSSNTKDEISQLSNEINSLLQRLEISFDKINQFSSDASHELKTPLTIIRGEIEIALRKDRDSKEYKETLNVCLDEILLIQQTIDDLLFLAKNENNKDIYKEDAYIDEITSDAIKELKPYAKLKNINIQSQIKDIFQIKGHPKLLKIAIKNILKNAISFSHENSDVIIKNYIEDDDFIISIEDKGIGIAQEEQTKIFEKFYRTDKSRNKESGGTGLGMAIVEKIISGHNGKIDLKSSENKGTTVKLIFTKNRF
ncbi:integral membrane sensor signal transduction histidine kinase [Arcobacter nitrofigilis DSM 7299]|uniref:histidine kinase n=1 Tax=Arcobacter nitrofigilis (strain ATCC 33309 / DSM 7299 / CCUG 15893 / LMG 7604 / NCTC 12251 / CI) TaxID=572480 RepID=D5V806_ARCNC|nr:HAMP domain-containing sensor histidine kinase [Arcobacter nitrofigilis]ADG94776.1 integral membrane sensor signal transduction histidine kinase [Arcobacter nitrofigilis DSM 7299]